MYAGASGSCSGVFLRATLSRRSETNVRTLSANGIPVLQSRRRLSTALLSSPTTTTGRRRVIGSSDPVTGAPSEACAIRTGRTQSSLPHQVTSCLPTKSSRAFTSGTKSLFRSSPQLHLPPKTNTGVMSLQKETLKAGDGATYPKEGDTVVMEYTGWLYDSSGDKNRGKQFDSSVGRGDFKTPIGVGRVIQGWDQGVPQMSLGERAVLTIPGKMAYGNRGFPGLIPPNATLIFEVELKDIHRKQT